MLEGALIQRLPEFKKKLTQLLQDRPDTANQVFYIKIVIRAAAKINIINNACQWEFLGLAVIIKDYESFRSPSLMELNAITCVLCHLEAVD